MIGSGNKCTITNRNWNQSLYSGDVDNDVGRRQFFTWIPGGFDSRCDWKIETLFTDSGLKFKLKSLDYDEYFYAANDNLKYDKNRRNVYSKIAVCDCNHYHWEIQPVPGCGGYVTIKRTKYDEYLYAAQDNVIYDIDRRRVFTWKYTSKDEAVACHWTIQCN